MILSNVYTVVTGEDYSGITSFDLFDTEEKATAHAKELMAEYLHDHFKWEGVNGAVANWRMASHYITIFLKEVN